MESEKTLNVNRRGFCKAAMAAAAGLALSSECSLVGCTPEKQQEVEEQLVQGTWVNSGCYFNCGGRCINKIYVVDGVPVKQKTDDTHEDSFDYPQFRGCPKGRLMRNWVLADDRLRFPMKRKHWQPGGVDYHPELRGKDEWERITWDEALDMCASEMKRIKAAYGCEAFLNCGLMDYRAGLRAYTGWLLNAFGGCTTTWGQQSSGATPHPIRTMVTGGGSTADRYNLLKSKLVVMWGTNPAWSLAGNAMYFYSEAKRHGAKFIVVDPWYSATAQALADQWIAIRPGTDAALLCALAYHMIVNDLQDQEFIDKYMLGFDADHMPEGSEGKENFKDYILGKYDGTPKTPEWASEICGVPVDEIEQLAYEMATTKPMALKAGWAPSRVYNGLNFVQLYYTVGWMCGNVGKPGGEVSCAAGSPDSAFNGPRLVTLGAVAQKTPDNPVCGQPRGGGALQSGKYDPDMYYGIAYAEVFDAILTGEANDFVHGRRKVNLKAYIHDAAFNMTNQFVNGQKCFEAFRAEGKLEFVLVADMFMSSDAMLADIILPACTTWEFGDEQEQNGQREILIWGNKVMEPIYESRPDTVWQYDLAMRLGIDPAVMEPLPWPAAQKTRLATSTVVKQGNTAYETEFLAEVTEDDIAEFGLACEAHEGRVPFKKLLEDGVYQVPRSENDGYGWTQFQDFIADPEAHPMGTSTGKFEIYCPALHDAIEIYGTTHIDPLPKYEKSVEGYEDSFVDWENKVKGEYDMQLLSVHHLARAHSTYNNVRVLNELLPDNLMINTLDAKRLGIKHGDTVLVSNARGKMLRRASVIDGVMPGVVCMGQGNWFDIDEETGIDRGGCVNMLTGGYLVGEGHNPYNTVLVKVEKWTGAPLTPMYLQPTRKFDENGGKQW